MSHVFGTSVITMATVIAGSDDGNNKKVCSGRPCIDSSHKMVATVVTVVSVSCNCFHLNDSYSI